MLKLQNDEHLRTCEERSGQCTETHAGFSSNAMRNCLRTLALSPPRFRDESRVPHAGASAWQFRLMALAPSCRPHALRELRARAADIWLTRGFPAQHRMRGHGSPRIGCQQWQQHDSGYCGIGSGGTAQR